MHPDTMEYPQYRRTTDDRHFYRIEAMDRFTEIQVIGNRHLVHSVTARAYPELVRIKEMIEREGDRYQVISEDRWSKEISKVSLAKGSR